MLTPLVSVTFSYVLSAAWVAVLRAAPHFWLYVPYAATTAGLVEVGDGNARVTVWLKSGLALHCGG